jgi:hypothetical protein
MEVLLAIGAIIRAWPETVKFLNRLVDVFDQLKKAAAEKELNDWLTELDGTLAIVEKAKSLEERVNAAKKLADLVRRLG